MSNYDRGNAMRLAYQLLKTMCLSWLLAMSGQSLAVDTDGDGVADVDDAFPLDPSEVEDSDGDGTGDNRDLQAFCANRFLIGQLDVDGDCVQDSLDECPGSPLGIPTNDLGCAADWAQVGITLFIPTSNFSLSRLGAVDLSGSGSMVAVRTSSNIISVYNVGINDLNLHSKVNIPPSSSYRQAPLHVSGQAELSHFSMDDLGRRMVLSLSGVYDYRYQGRDNIPGLAMVLTYTGQEGYNWEQLGSDIVNPFDDKDYFPPRVVDISADGTLVAVANGLSAGSNMPLDSSYENSLRIMKLQGDRWDNVQQWNLGFWNNNRGNNSLEQMSLSPDGTGVIARMRLEGKKKTLGFGFSLSARDEPVEFLDLAANGVFAGASSNGAFPAIYFETIDEVSVFSSEAEQIGGSLKAGSSEFIRDLKLSGDGSTAIVGYGSSGADRGVVRVFRNSGGRWVKVGSDINGLNNGDQASYLAISDDGSVVAVRTGGQAPAGQNLRVFHLSLDSDGDGVLDAKDTYPLTDLGELTDTDRDGQPDDCAALSPSPCDGTEMASDADDDNDGVADTADTFPLDSTESVDTDLDGIGNNADTDDDGDTISDAVESVNGTDPLSIDTDGDGVGDNADVFALDASESSDFDGDGVGDNTDSVNTTLTFLKGVFDISVKVNNPSDNPVTSINLRFGGLNSDHTCFVSATATEQETQSEDVYQANFKWAIGDNYGTTKYGVINDTPVIHFSDGTKLYDQSQYYLDLTNLNSVAPQFKIESFQTTQTDIDNEVEFEIVVSGFGEDGFLLKYPASSNSRLDIKVHFANSADYVGVDFGQNNVEKIANDRYVMRGKVVITDTEDFMNPKLKLVSVCDASLNGKAWDQDSDQDGMIDALDAFPSDPNEYRDSDGDGTGNNADTDDDGDTVSDVDEVTSGTNPLLADTDRDGFSDAQELIDATDPLDKDDCATCTPPVSGIAYHWNTHALMATVEVNLAGITEGVANGVPQEATSNTSGLYAFTERHRDTNGMTASKVITDGESGSVISSADALAALKIAVGINPNTDPDGSGPLEALPVSPYQYIAADINGDGRITSADALAILKMAVKLDSAEPRRWVFVAEDYKFWDQASKSFKTTRTDVTWDSDGMIFDYPEKSVQNVVGVLMGDVNGNWSAPEGGEALDESYLSELIKLQGGSLAQWGLVDPSVEDDASEDAAKESDVKEVADDKDDTGTDDKDEVTDDEKDFSQDLPSVEIVVNGTVRDYYVYVPSNSDTSPMPLLYLLNGGSVGRTPFAQQSKFEAMADREGIVLVVPLGQKLPSNESAWQLNTDSSSMQDIDYIEAIYTDVSSRATIDANRVYAIGYSLGGMFSYELACQMSHRFAAIGSLAGSMPVAPSSCDPYRNVPILHVHGVQDEIIPYSSPWDWKAWDAVGTMRGTPSLIEFWSSRYNCSKQSETSITTTVDLDVREDCDSGARVEHYRLENGTHAWPTLIGGDETPEVFWSFLSSFSLESSSP